MNKKVILSLFASTLAIAGELSTATEIGYSNTSGNTSTEAFAFEFKGEKGFDQHNFTLDASALYSQDRGVTSKNKWFLGLNYDYAFAEKWAANYLIAYKQDKFSGYDYQFNTGPGVRYQWIKQENHDLKVGANVLYSSDKIEFTGTNDYISLGAGGEYEWQIVENLKFIQDLSAKSQVDEIDNYFVFSKTALESKITEMFSLGLSYKVDYAHIPAPTKKSTDTTFLAALIINY